MIRVLICDDQAVVSEGLRAILSTVDFIDVVGTVSNGKQAVEAAARLHPDVVLMELYMPVMNGVQATRLIHSLYQGIHVLALATFDFDEWISDAMHNGAQGYLMKDSPREVLAAGIQAAAAGKNSVNITPNINAG
jgi:two-component system, NarL family, response regulator LiaR